LSIATTSRTSDKCLYRLPTAILLGCTDIRIAPVQVCGTDWWTFWRIPCPSRTAVRRASLTRSVRRHRDHPEPAVAAPFPSTRLTTAGRRLILTSTRRAERVNVTHGPPKRPISSQEDAAARSLEAGKGQGRRSVGQVLSPVARGASTCRIPWCQCRVGGKPLSAMNRLISSSSDSSRPPRAAHSAFGRR
jgi:hypothetical protein